MNMGEIVSIQFSSHRLPITFKYLGIVRLETPIPAQLNFINAKVFPFVQSAISCSGGLSTDQLPSFRRNLNESEVSEIASLLSLLENVCIHSSRINSRKWGLDTTGSHSNKCYYCYLSNSGSESSFNPHGLLWLSRTPSKVKILSWLMAHRKVNTCDMV
ncbi:hypothetical protein PRUPE_2G149100 [Prunus persica]|uniref:Reverse transcriptase zinc-binding domain-containing protein n=1 Tax=Prunus persica TaxID=3760 RepID=A0A251QG22_PRUPE|nr:hypothetical protein PRUPE_2G149100 [Prunus persica]